MGRIFTRRIVLFIAAPVGFVLFSLAGYFIDQIFLLLAGLWVVGLSYWLSRMRCPNCDSRLDRVWFPYFMSSCPKCGYRL